MESPAVVDIPFSTALIIDNKPDDVKSLSDDLENKNVMVILAKDSTTAKAILEQRPELDIIVLDWLLNEEDPIEAKELLSFLQKRIFAPVIIYTDKGKDEPLFFINERKLGRIVRVIDKGEVKGEKVLDEVDEWLKENPELRIFLRWSRQVEMRLNEALWIIHDLDVDGIASILELLEPQDEPAHVSKEEGLTNFFTRILDRTMGNNKKLLENVKKDIEALPKKTKTSEAEPEKAAAPDKEEVNAPESKIDVDKLRAFHCVERYRPPDCNSLWTGSILQQKSGEYFIVVTPLCDLFNKNKIENILLLVAEPLDKYKKTRTLSKGKTRSCIEHKSESVHFLPYAAGLSDGLICRFDSLFNMNDETLRKGIENGEILCVGVIDSPFVENLIQRMNAYLMRLGVRALSGKEIDKLLGDEKQQ